MPKSITIKLADVKIGQYITVLHKDEIGSTRGSGGKVTALTDDLLRTQHNDFLPKSWATSLFTTTHWIETEVPFEARECLNYGPDGAECDGPVEYHSVGGGKRWLRCTAHARIREQHYETSMERYANQSTPPAWFDPTYAGESWNED